MAKTLSIFGKIHFLRERYYKVAVKKESLLKLLGEAEVAEQVYNSNAIENSTLTLEETEKILLQIDLILNQRQTLLICTSFLRYWFRFSVRYQTEVPVSTYHDISGTCRACAIYLY
jgi:hypothetical protein